MSAIDILTALLRGLHVAALVSLFGVLLFAMLALPSDPATERIRARLQQLARISALAALVAGIAWILLQTAAIAGTGSIAATLHALPVVALRTQFGHWLLLRLALLLATLPLLRRVHISIPIVLAGAALALQPLLGHAGAIGGSAGTQLIASEALHLLAAGAWLGGLLPLLIAVANLPRAAAAAACRAFTPIGLASILLLAGTAVAQIATLVGGVPGLFGTDYGHVALVKLTLFALLLALAALNRFVLTEQLAAPDRARPRIRLSIATEIVLGLLVILTAGFLASRTPGTHEQPVWPFAWRLSLAAFTDANAFALGAAALGIAIAAVGAFRRRIRWPALAAAVAIEAFALPRLDVLFVPAYPTSYFTSPTEFAATAIAHGARLFATNCVSCHGAEARGDGPAAQSLPMRPADLTAEHFRFHNDGDLYWFVSHGFKAPDGTVAMPGFAGVLSTEAIWDLIDYLRAHNAGDAFHRTGNWPRPVPVPQFDAQCANGQVVDLDDLRGRALQLVAMSDDETTASHLPDDVAMPTVLVEQKMSVRPPATACVASEPQLWTALAILLGLPSPALSGTHIVVDQNGWLRAVWRPEASDPQVVSAQLRDILSHPLAVDLSTTHAHHH